MDTTRLTVAGLLTLALGAAAPAQQNVLLLIADDLGIDNVSAYGAHPNPAHTPNLDALAAGGMLFLNAYSNPLCSPTRATILTGRYAHHTGMGDVVMPALDVPLALDEVTLAEALSPVYRSAAVGKWHLGSDPQHPLQQGFVHHWGTLGPIPSTAAGTGNGYFDYWKNVDGTLVHSTEYATTETVDDALTLIGMLPPPWFLCVGFNAPHTPFHVPPAGLHSYSLPATVAGNEPIYSKAMIEAMDSEIGRLVSSLGSGILANTTIIVVGDNGPDAKTVTAPWDPSKVKKTVYEGGIHVPLIVAGPGVAAGAQCSGLVNTTDIFATVADIAGVRHPTAIDSVSLVPYFSDPGRPSLRAYAYSEFFTPHGLLSTYQYKRRAVRGQRYKLIHEYYSFSPAVASKQLFDLWADPFETNNLLAGTLTLQEQAALTDLSVALVTEGPAPWQDVGQALAGSHGPPSLEMTGSLVADSPVTLAIHDAKENALVAIVIGSYAMNAPFQGGTIVPAPELIELVVTDGSGDFSATSLWPPGGPSLQSVSFQAWIQDQAGPFGLAATNALTGTTPP